MVWAAEQYCVENGARVITMSLGVKGELSTSLMRSERLNMNNLRDAGVTMFNSAGNYHYEFDPPIELGLTARVVDDRRLQRRVAVGAGGEVLERRRELYPEGHPQVAVSIVPGSPPTVVPHAR